VGAGVDLINKMQQITREPGQGGRSQGGRPPGSAAKVELTGRFSLTHSAAQVFEQTDAVLGLAERLCLGLELLRADPAVVKRDLLRRRDQLSLAVLQDADELGGFEQESYVPASSQA
jgi:hypothetical protein